MGGVMRNQLEELENDVEDLKGLIPEVQANHAVLDAKVSAILAKLSISEASINGNDSGGENLREHKTSPPQLFNKIDLPTFDRFKKIDFDPFYPEAWLIRAEQFFLVHEIPVTNRVKYALGAMVEPAVAWMLLLLRLNPELTWQQFSQEILVRFGNVSAFNEYEALKNTTQTGSLEHYICKFESKMAWLKVFSEAECVGYFLAGLKKSLRAQMYPMINTYSMAIKEAWKLDHATQPNVYALYQIDIPAYSLKTDAKDIFSHLKCRLPFEDMSMAMDVPDEQSASRALRTRLFVWREGAIDSMWVH
ncbi:hypothetical protein SASPL_143157 [Salvia splendens]|uniref:Retrotransposon gag domain-containing protein n=1 Tax=Salvia splendens TaxID=180675 RepID=A0A8X8WLM6_SALSN|nr:hypothetical protein SASPL_143157 [Salvia splendens]